MHPKCAAILHILSADIFSFLVAKGAREVLLVSPLSGAAACLCRGCSPTHQADGGWELRHVFCAQDHFAGFGERSCHAPRMVTVRQGLHFGSPCIEPCALKGCWGFGVLKEAVAYSNCRSCVKIWIAIN